MLTALFAIAIAGMAEREKRSPWIWGILTALLSACIQTFLIVGYFAASGIVWRLGVAGRVHK